MTSDLDANQGHCSTHTSGYKQYRVAMVDGQVVLSDKQQIADPHAGQLTLSERLLKRDVPVDNLW